MIQRTGSLVYFLDFGGIIKIGFSTNLPARMESFRTTAPFSLKLLATFPGGRAEELRIHKAFADHRANGEFFHPAPYVTAFIGEVKAGDMESAWRLLEQYHSYGPRKRKQPDPAREKRLTIRRERKREMDARCRQLVTERNAREAAERQQRGPGE